MKKLNKIEQNFIFQNFVKDKPTIRLISKSGKITKVENNKYRIDNNIIEFSADFNFQEEEYKLLFPHKGRLILSDILMQKKRIVTFFVFPNDLFLYDEDKNQNTTAKLILQINKKLENNKNELVNTELNLQLLKSFPLFNFEKDLLCEQTNNTLLTNVTLMLRYQNNRLADEFCISRLYFFLQQLASGEIPELETTTARSFLSLIFLSEKCAVFFLPENIFKLFTLSVTNSLMVKVKKRFMNLSLGKAVGTMKLKQSPVLDSDMALMAVSTENIAIEDKRFLYENIYNTKYGKL